MYAGATFLVNQHITAEIVRGFDLAARFLDDESNAFCCRAKLLVFVYGDSFYSWLVNVASVVPALLSGKRIGCFNALRISRTSRRCARAVFVSRPWMIGLPRGRGVLFKIAIAPPEIPNNRGLASIDLDVLDGILDGVHRNLTR